MILSLCNLRRYAGAATFAVLSLLLVACGGGGGPDGVGSSGTGTAPSGVQVGSITGFGSVIVEGNVYDTSSASLKIERVPGSALTVTETDLRLGMRIELEYDAQERAQTGTVRPELLGVVQAVGANTLTVAGQLVRADTLLGVPTAFEGVQALGDLQPGDRVEVHGVREPIGETVLATRIERRDAAGTLTRVSGLVTSVASDRSTLRLGALTVRTPSGLTTLPNGATIQAGHRVSVASTAPLDNTGALVAQILKLESEAAPSAPGQGLRVAGVVRQSNPAAATFVVGQRTVRWDAATRFVGGTSSDLANAVPVRVRGTWLGADLLASEIRFQLTRNDARIDIDGAVSDFVSLASFKVRGTRVDASAAGVNFSGGVASQIGNGAIVRVEGFLTNDQLVPTRVVIRNASTGSSGSGSVDTEGVVAQLSVLQRTLRVNGVIVRWTPGTVIDGQLSDLRLGVEVRARGSIVGGELQATELRIRARD